MIVGLNLAQSFSVCMHYLLLLIILFINIIHSIQGFFHSSCRYNIYGLSIVGSLFQDWANLVWVGISEKHIHTFSIDPSMNSLC